MKRIKTTFIACYKSIAVSIGLLIIPLFSSSTMVYLIVCFLLLVTWCYQYHALNVKHQDYVVLLKQVGELRYFSLELQAFISQELCLVKENISQLQSINLQANKILQDNIDILRQSEYAMISHGKKTIIDFRHRAVIKALQSEDMGHQISEHIVKHIDEINRVVNILADVYRYDSPSNINNRLVETRVKMNGLRNSLFELHARKPVAGKSMNAGDIELF